MNFKMFYGTFNCWIWQCLFIYKFLFKGFTDSFVRFCFEVMYNNENSHFMGKWCDNFFEHEHTYRLQHVTIVLDRFRRLLYTISVTFQVILKALCTFFIRLHSRRVVMCLVVVYVRSFVCVRSFVPSLIPSQVFNIIWPNLKYRKKKVPRRFYAILHWVTTLRKFVINYYFKSWQLDTAWMKYYIYNTAENIHHSRKTFK